MPDKSNDNEVWVVTVDMGYGHLRAAHPFRDIARDGIIIANRYSGIPERDRTLWEGTRGFYESISRMKHLPIIGDWVFGFMDYLQRIPEFYPNRDLSRPTLQVKEIYKYIRDKNWGRHLIERLARHPRPLLTPFFTTAFFAEEHGYPGEIYCLTTDTDVSRAWAPLAPRKSRIRYLAANTRCLERLKRYGVPGDNIFLTGFPLPDENIGGRGMPILKRDLGERLCNLDPARKYLEVYEETVIEHIGKQNYKRCATRPLTVTFAVGGAGAQRELGGAILESLMHRLQSSEVRLVLVAGSREDVRGYFTERAHELKLEHLLQNGNLTILWEKTKEDYFVRFNEALRDTDVLWTKPSELSFYTALGLPIIIAPSIGSQEVFNQRWLREIGAGMPQEDPRYTDEWLFDWVRSGWLAEAAMNGFLDAPKFGTYNIKDVMAGRGKPVEEPHQVL